LAALLAFADARAEHVDTAVPELVRLQGALQQYQHIADNGGWPVVPTGPTIEPGSRDLRVPTLAARLQKTCDLISPRDTWTVYDDELQAAVIRFQARHGLEPDALVGKATLRALNVPAARRVEQLATNLERARQIYNGERSDFILVNVPAFEARLIRGGKTAWSTRVVVGEPDAETPAFEASLQQIVLNPTWTVPRSIASEELLPEIKANRAFLSRGGYELYGADGNPVDPATVNWAALHRNNFPYTLVQRAGPNNELGQVKFPIPNEYGVCMHDTPKKPLFSHYFRAYSHGCIRVDRPLEMAERLLEVEGWTRADIDAQLASGQTRSIRLTEPLPVVVTYLTAKVDQNGTVFFYRDVYGRD
jgi:murein L,D-transpeptidase YcbB/YkuD